MKLYKNKGSNVWRFGIMLSVNGVRKREIISSGTRDKRSAEMVRSRVLRLRELRESGGSPDSEMRNWITEMKPRLRLRLTDLGLITSAQAAVGAGLEQHIEDYLRFCQYEEQSEVFIKIKGSQLRRMVALTGARTLSDFTFSSVSSALQSLKDKGRSARTLNQNRTSLTGWLSWCVRQKLLDGHELGQLPRLNEDVDRRRERRAATEDELRRFFDVLPPKRLVVFKATVYTGLRRSEMNQIERRDIDLEAKLLTVRAVAGKKRKPASLPLHEEMVTMLKSHIKDMAPNDKVFAPVPKMTTYRRDLERAGIAYQDENGHYLDYHALRSTHTTMLLRTGVPPAIARRLTRHSSVQTLEKYYDKLGLNDAQNVVNRLPKLGPNDATPPPAQTPSSSTHSPPKK